MVAFGRDVARGRAVRAVLLALLCALAVPAQPAHASSQPGRITVIGDSVMTAVQWNAQPLSILEQGFADVDLQIAVCRRLAGSSCPFEGERPPNLVDLVPALGDKIGSVVVVEVGYNDPEEGFAAAVDSSVQTLLAAGVRRIFWVNYHDWVAPFARLNAILAQTVARYPQVTVVDWQAASLNRYSWFQSDGIHLVLEGAVALASLIHEAIVDTPTAVPSAVAPIVAHAPTAAVARVGRRFTVRLNATGGEAPLRWRVTGGPLGRGLHLLASGVLTGTPTKAGRIPVNLLVTDVVGDYATVRLMLTVRPRAPDR